MILIAAQQGCLSKAILTSSMQPLLRPLLVFHSEKARKTNSDLSHYRFIFLACVNGMGSLSSVTFFCRKTIHFQISDIIIIKIIYAPTA